ncbi:cellulose synthase-like protein H1-like protein, partial [Corchorus olitorius]
MAKPEPLPLCERVSCKSIIERSLNVIIFCLYLCLVSYRLNSLNNHGYIWLLAFLCELWFTFDWLLKLITWWNPVEHKTYPENLFP